MTNVPVHFAQNVFGPEVMASRLPKDTFRAVEKTLNEGKRMDLSVANVVANAMKDWAIERGVTHYTHWFQPMTGFTAEKHESFLHVSAHGRTLMEFSGKELIRGEPDASSFPSGGLRSTFEARGYTAWDPTSFAFIKDGVLCIPTAFCSYGGEALDQKTPLLRSMEALNRQAIRLLRAFGQTDVVSVKPSVGAEQEYFLIDERAWEKRKDLQYTGRTLFGAAPPKGQEMDCHYFGVIHPRVRAFMEEVNLELWKLGVPVKTLHNEAAPAQHEIAPLYTVCNLALDHNQLCMELLQKVARRHGMVCLLHEKPFASISGSGKHNNWSLSTDKGINLLEPGETPHENAQFLLFLCAVIEAVDTYQDLLRCAVASAGNDLRLGASEAPPAVLSVYLGKELTDILFSIENGTPYGKKEKEVFKVGVHALPKFQKDSTDRNRTSPFAFTGNKFEFRMLGASSSISEVNVVLNTAVADVLCRFADRLTKADNPKHEMHDLIRDTVRAHKRILFNGNGYGSDWTVEAKARGLLNLAKTPDALPYLLNEKNVSLYARHGVYGQGELHARFEVASEQYCQVVITEAKTMILMVKQEILPSANKYVQELTKTITAKPNAYASETVLLLTELIDTAFHTVSDLERVLKEKMSLRDTYARAAALGRDGMPLIEKLRGHVDRLEETLPSEYWPYPTYADLLLES